MLPAAPPARVRPAAAAIGAGHAAFPIQARKKGKLLGALGGLAAGAGLGALIGSVIPVVGTAIGALIGGAIGLFSGLGIGHLVDRSASRSSLAPATPMRGLRDQFTRVDADVDRLAPHAVPDYVGAEIASSGGRYQAPPPAMRDYQNRLVHKHRELQRVMGPQGVRVLARFYVDDHNVGRTHPGLDSWASLQRGGGGQRSSSEIRELASSHMTRGHDVQGSGGQNLVQHSPLVSASDDLARLIMADSPYNTARSAAMMGNEMVAAGQQRDAQGGRHVSDRIVKLTYGFRSDVEASALGSTVHPSTHLAFLGVNPDYEHLYTAGSIGASQDDCCTLEGENVVYAPQANLGDVMVGRVPNQLNAHYRPPAASAARASSGASSAASSVRSAGSSAAAASSSSLSASASASLASTSPSAFAHGTEMVRLGPAAPRAPRWPARPERKGSLLAPLLDNVEDDDLG